MNFSLDLARPLAAFFVFALLAAWALRAYARSLPPLPAGRRILLTSLRLAASLLLALMIGGLSGVLRIEEREPHRLRVLVDASASMSRAAGAATGSPSRYESALALLAGAEERWGGRLELIPAHFGLGLDEGEPPLAPTAGGTDIGAALAALPTPRPGESGILISDGRDTEGGLWASRLQAGRPLHTVLLGDTLPPADLRIERVDALPVVHRGTRLTLGVELSSQGGGARAGRFAIRDGERELTDLEWEMAPGQSRLRLEIPLIFDETGRHLVEMRAIGEGGQDEAQENNRRLLSVQVIEGKLEILALAGSPDYDLATIVRGLQGETGLALTLVTAGPDGELREVATGEPWRPEDAEYHGLLLHSLHRSWPANLLDRLRIQGGVLMLQPFLRTANGERLPKRWQLPRQPVGERLAELRLGWGAAASRHPALQGALAAGLDPREQAPVAGALVCELPGARVLLADADSNAPVLVTRELGGERLALFTAEAYWRWGLRSSDGGLLPEEIFSGLLRWLAREDPPGRLQVSWEGESLIAGQPGELSAEFFDPDFSPLAGASLSWRLRRDGELIRAGEFGEEGRAEYRTSLPALPEGVYELEVQAREPGGELVEKTVELPVLPPDREMLHPAANPESLRWLAARSGGIFLASGGDGREALLDAIERKIDFEPERRSVSRALRLWQHPLAFLLLLALLAAEWGLRKRFGMV